MNADTDFSAGLSYALAYAAMGIPVLPLMPGKKTPHGNLAPRGFKDATTSVATLRHWWGACPGAGIGIYPGPAGLLVIDVDVKGAAVGLATLERLQSTYGPLPSTLTQRTPSGGWHYVFQAPFQAGNGHKLGPGIDVRGGSGYIVVEPTIIDGNAYRWIDWEVTSGRAPAVALLPSWMEPLLLLKDAKPVLGNLETVVAKSDTYVSPETLSDLRLALTTFKPDEYNEWVRVGMCLKGLGQAGFFLWDEWSRGSEKYGAEEVVAKWAQLEQPTAGYRAIFAAAQAHGWANPRTRPVAVAQQPGNATESATPNQRAQGLGDASPKPGGTPTPLPDELSIVPPFPTDALPPSLRGWVEDIAERMQCPADFVAVPTLVGAASLVARRVGVRPQDRTEWLERGNLWALIVGAPGSMKSPALMQALGPLYDMERRAAREFSAAMGAFEQDCQSYKLIAGVAEKQAKGLLAKDLDADITAQLRPQEPPIPTRKRYIVNDLTYEKLGVILAENPDGILSVRDEIRGLLQHLSREEQAQARAFYLQSWSGGSYTFDRIMRGTTTIEDVRLSVIGCIQPGPVGELILNARRGASDDGMLERFLACWPDGTGAWKEVDRWPDTQAKLAARQTFARLGMV